MSIIRVSSSCFVLFVFVCLWHCECVIKCSYLAWMQCQYFKDHLQPFRSELQNAKICWEALAKRETLNYCDSISSLLLRWRFLIKNDQNNLISTWQNQNYLKECRKLGRYQTRSFVRTFIFIIFTCCVHHPVRAVLQLRKSFDPTAQM